MASRLSNLRSHIPNLNSRYLMKAVLLVLIYVISAKLGLSLAFTTKQITAVWPPTGIAIAALFLLGFKYWPSILAGAFVANILTHEPVAVALGIGIGNTLEALTGAYLLRRTKISQKLSGLQNVLVFIVVAALISPLVGATIGTLSLALGKLVTWSTFTANWAVWWVGDAMGALIFAPLILVYSGIHQIHFSFKQLRQFGLLLTLILATSVLVFSQSQRSGLTEAPYIIFPLLIWVALKFEQIGVVTATLLISMSAVWGTVNKLGPFSIGQSTDQNLIFLHLFIFTVYTTSLILAATESERRSAEQTLKARTIELEQSQAIVLEEVEQRKGLEVRLKEANSRMTNILSGILNDKADTAPISSDSDRL